MTAARLVLDRIAPPCRDPRVCLPVPPLQSAGDLPRIRPFSAGGSSLGRGDAGRSGETCPTRRASTGRRWKRVRVRGAPPPLPSSDWPGWPPLIRKTAIWAPFLAFCYLMRDFFVLGLMTFLSCFVTLAIVRWGMRWLSPGRDVVSARAIRAANGSFNFEVTIRSQDRGWDHYADWFEHPRPGRHGPRRAPTRSSPCGRTTFHPALY